ncbi:hypothetical protein RS130_22055 [Paraglaciecola aquimarina]|uniref:Phosphate ABC transporter substrate-binding protein n=1 Tax=Paraglaciecola aquimarina TaxID=1235557 RepID=A0ABU3T1V2_9ALTE|nr:hypothetical protein [Paraglaciecola aquimarina]MDU0356207.1 hypothetical protein [Paraglaciecola aquimarina]
MDIKKIISITTLTVLMSAGHASADILVVVNKHSETTKLSKNELIDLYMGRFRTFPNSKPARLYDRSDLRNEFYRQLIDKSVSEVNAFWARLLFTGRAKPPEALDTTASLLEVLNDDMQAIGYINESDMQASMKVVYRISRR